MTHALRKGRPRNNIGLPPSRSDLQALIRAMRNAVEAVEHERVNLWGHKRLRKEVEARKPEREDHIPPSVFEEAWKRVTAEYFDYCRTAPVLEGEQPTMQRLYKSESMVSVREETISGRGKVVARRFPSLVERLFNQGKITKDQANAAEAYHRDWVMGGYTGAEVCQQWREYVQQFGGGGSAAEIKEAAKRRYRKAARLLSDNLYRVAEVAICFEAPDAHDQIARMMGYAEGGDHAKGAVTACLRMVCAQLELAYSRY